MRRWKVIGMAALLCLGLSLLVTLLPRESGVGETLRFADAEEEKLLYMMAAEISPEYEMETLKMQAVIDRTRCRKAQEDQTKEPAQLTPRELAQRWGENYSAYYEKFQKAIIATSGEVITCGGDYIYPEYHYLSDGRTRSMEEVYGRSDFPYLQSVESSQDMEEPDYLNVFFVKKKDFQEKCRQTWNLPGEAIENVTLDSAGYVRELTVDGRTISGEEMQRLLDLPSCSFSIKDAGDEYRIVTKGIGHGFGVSIYGANEMAKMGATYASILQYYYTGIEISAE